MSTLGVIGAGKLGTAIARLGLDGGYRVLLSGSARQPLLNLVIETVAPGATLVSESELVAQSDIVILAIPFGNLDAVNFEALDGKIVVDAMNAWDAAGGHPDQEWNGPTTALVQARNPAMRLVKSLNHIGYTDLVTDARPAGHPLRRAVGVVSDDDAARRQVAALVDTIGFDPVEADATAFGALEPDSPIFGVPSDSTAMREALTHQL